MAGLGIFTEISLIIVLAVIVCSVLKLLRQPLFIGYILTGVIISPLFLDLVRSTDAVAAFSQIGVALLLFIVGINLNPKALKEFGWISLAISICQIAFTAIIGLLLSFALGFNFIASLYIAIALTFSSTIIIMKMLSDKNALDTLYGKISIGLLLVQDVIAIFMLIIISAFSLTGSLQSIVLQIAVKGIGLALLLFSIGYLLFPRLKQFMGNSQEYLFIFSIGWCLAWASLFAYAGFSIEIGALLAGISLSISPFHFEISSRIRPLRDFFIVLFFIFLGTQMNLADISGNIIIAIVLSLFVLIAKPIIIMVTMGMMGFTKRNSFMVGMITTQISEFSLIIVALGASFNHVSQGVLSLVTIVGLITISGSAYMILYSERLYETLSPLISIFEKKGKKVDEYRQLADYDYDVILWGYNRIGFDLLIALKKRNEKFLVIDFNPVTILDLTKEGVPCRYGDASDIELLDELKLNKVKMVVSTIPDIDVNLLLINYTRKKNKKAIIIAVSHDIDEANKLYSAGASYVLMPHFLGGHHVAKMIEKHGFKHSNYLKEKEEHLRILELRKKKGHVHPRANREHK